jgi:hypothetical protein
LVVFGGFAAKTNQKTARGGFAAPNPTAEAGIATALIAIYGYKNLVELCPHASANSRYGYDLSTEKE